MNDKQIVKAALTRTGTTQAALSGKIGHANKANIAAMLSRPGTIRMDIFFKILDALGFEIVVRPKNKADKVEWLLSEDETPIETKQFVDFSEIGRIESEIKPHVRK